MIYGSRINEKSKKPITSQAFLWRHCSEHLSVDAFRWTFSRESWLLKTLGWRARLDARCVHHTPSNEDFSRRSHSDSSDVANELDKVGREEKRVGTITQKLRQDPQSEWCWFAPQIATGESGAEFTSAFSFGDSDWQIDENRWFWIETF